VEIGTTDTSELHSIQSPPRLQSNWKPHRQEFCLFERDEYPDPLPVFNVNGSPNETGQISEVVDIVLCYKTHSKRMLLAVFGLGKQSLILGYDWLKDHNPKIDWEKGEVEMICCPLQYEKGHALWKEQTHQKRIEL